MTDNDAEVLDIVEKLKLGVLKEFQRKLEDKSLSGTDLSTLVRLLEHNGWVLDPSRIPQGLKDKLLSTIDPKKFSKDDADAVIGRIA